MLFISLIITMLSGCASIGGNEDYRRITSISMGSLVSAIENTPSKDVKDVLSNAEPLNSSKFSVEINSLSASTITIDEQRFLAKAYRKDGTVFANIEINSYIIPVKGKPDYLFFPSITVFDTNSNKLATINPNDDYRIYGGELVATYKIPQEAEYLLIHTEEKYLPVGSIDGKNGGLHPGTNYSNQNLGVAVAGVLGGAIGGAIAGAVSAGSYNSSAPAENYFFGPGGVIDIKLKET